MTKRICLAVVVAISLAAGADRLLAETTSVVSVAPFVGAPMVTVSASYRLTAELSCPAGYLPIVASCNAGNSVVVNYQTPPPLPPNSRWAYYLTTNGVHCETGSAYILADLLTLSSPVIRRYTPRSSRSACYATVQSIWSP